MQQQRSGFTLVELSIVLVILGLLVGGVLTGQSLIRASELRALTTEYNGWLTANQAFRDKYFSMAGDMTNATAFWGKDNASCTGDTGTTATPGTCNGNGDSTINQGSGANATAEMYRYWQQLALAGLIAGTYSGTTGPSGVLDSNSGVNTPRSKMGNAGWSIYSWGFSAGVNPGGSAPIFDGNNYNNVYMVGGDAVNLHEQSRLKAEEAWNIDTKVDDGRPALGSVRVFEANTSCHDAGTSTTVALAPTANYALSNTTLGCTLLFNSAM